MEELFAWRMLSIVWPITYYLLCNQESFVRWIRLPNWDGLECKRIYSMRGKYLRKGKTNGQTKERGVAGHSISLTWVYSFYWTKPTFGWTPQQWTDMCYCVIVVRIHGEGVLTINGGARSTKGGGGGAILQWKGKAWPGQSLCWLKGGKKDKNYRT